jgi:hypothetical protein
MDRKGPSPMAETQSRPRLVRFGAFEADVQTGELRKDGVKLKLVRMSPFGGSGWIVAHSEVISQ